MVKHALLLLATVLGFAVSIAMMQRAVGPASPWVALLCFLCFLGVVHIADPIYALKMPASLRTVRPWEMRGTIYRRLGVPGFGTLLRDTPLRYLNTRVYLSGDRRDRIPRLRRQLESAEAAHFWGALLLMPYVAWCAWSRRWDAFGWFVVLQVLGNAYPVMHLRSVRGRLTI